MYKGQSQPLIDNENPAPTNPKKLGLAEFSNGNFLSEDALYAELYKPGGTHYAPLPSILTGTDYVLVRDNPFEGTDYELFADQISRQRLFLIKGEGVPVLHHSVLSYLGVRFPVFNPSTLIQYGVSIDSPAVLNDYLTILIPKAIEYSTGILDYFFRGRVQLIVTFNSDPAPGDGHYGLQIIDISGVGQDFHAGTYALYSDDLSGLRTAVTFPYVTYPDSGATGTFDVPSGTRANYTILYRGIIGSDGYDEVLDPVDASSAIAAKQFHILRLNIVPEPATLDDLDVDVYLVDPFGEIVYFDHPSSNMGANIDQDGGTIGPYSFQGNITLGNVVDGDYQVWVNYHSEGDVSLHSAATVTLNTFFNSQDPLTSETFTLVSPNGGSNRPIGIAGPATQASWYIRRLIKIRNGQLTQY